LRGHLKLAFSTSHGASGKHQTKLEKRQNSRIPGCFCSDDANHVLDFRSLQGISHYNNTSTASGATIGRRQSNVNKKYNKYAKDLDADLQGTLPVQQRPIETEFNEYGLYGGTPTYSCLVLDLLPVSSPSSTPPTITLTSQKLK